VLSVIESAAAVLVQFSDRGWCALLEQHVADRGGHCRACRDGSGAAPVWPCRLWAIADTARRMSGESGPSEGSQMRR